MKLVFASESWIAAGTKCRDAFMREIARVKYSDEETLDAWRWFREGWLALRDQFVERE